MRFVRLIDYYRYANTTISYSSFNRLDNDSRATRYELLQSLNDLNVSVLAYCLMPNHFHLLIKQIKPGGITMFMRHIQDGYAKYFNITSNRVGPLYQSSFKAVRIESDEQLVHVSRYIHLNPVTAFLIENKKLVMYPWSSLLNYVGEDSNYPPLVETDSVLSFFKNKYAYMQFIYNQISYQRELAKIKHLIFE